MTAKTIEQLQAELDAALAAKRTAEDAKRKAQTEAWRTLVSDPDSWEWHCRPEQRQGFSDDVRTSGLRISTRVKPALLEKWREGGLPQFTREAQDGRWLGMYYYRTDEGILTSDGGGFVVLQVPVLCSDAQWEDLKRGIVPRKWQRMLG